ncbi:TatD family hydrolase [Bacteroidales bacterium OttesenSCG-928-K03]|nr:TatD family hydrolase [Odoribacter sp. OttesenSCG-928-L07]MDL2240159.1 TatD family hydrolase [Bacteroidales bacterium OttesenSCG-928-K22]MDL2242486.1 TatD family hydrolase [Bacteroidales bacterium OttesenSCG-928-K03]
MITFTDTHSHIFIEDFDDDRAEMIKNIVDAGIIKMILPNIDKDSIHQLKSTLCDYPEYCFGAMGLHPTSVKEDYKEQLQAIEEELFLNKDKYIAIGEIGLDLYWEKTYFEQQVEVLRKQFDWALELKLPIIIHSRKSEDHIINIIRDKKYSDLRGVFHCWPGSKEQTKRVLDLGFYLGIGGVVTYKNSSLPELLQDVNIESILLETDSPYLSPVPFRGKRNDSRNILLIAEKVSETKGVSMEHLSEVTNANVKKLFGI